MTTPEPDRRCRTCKYWTPPGNPEWKLGQCQHPKLNLSVGDKAQEDAMHSWDETLVGPDFGCVHWEAKEQT